MKKLLTVREAARYTGLAESTLYSWVWQKKIPFIKMGKAVRFDLADLDRFIDLHRIEPDVNLAALEDLPLERG